MYKWMRATDLRTSNAPIVLASFVSLNDPMPKYGLSDSDHPFRPQPGQWLPCAPGELSGLVGCRGPRRKAVAVLMGGIFLVLSLSLGGGWYLLNRNWQLDCDDVNRLLLEVDFESLDAKTFRKIVQHSRDCESCQLLVARYVEGGCNKSCPKLQSCGTSNGPSANSSLYTSHDEQASEPEDFSHQPVSSPEQEIFVPQDTN